MSNEVAVSSGGALVAQEQLAEIARLQAEAFPVEVFKAAGGGEGFAAFLPNIKLFSPTSEEVKRMRIEMGTYGAVRGKEKQLIPLGKNMLLVPLAWRPKAMDLRESGKVRSYHKAHSKEFMEVKATADRPGQNGCMAGIEYLVYLDHKVDGLPLGFCNFFFGSKTARNEAGKMRALLPIGTSTAFRPAMCTTQLIEDEKNSWFGPVVMPSAQFVELPGIEVIMPQIMSFINPKDSEVVEEGDKTKEVADR